MGNSVDTIGVWMQNPILTALDSFTIPRIELEVRSINASSGRDAASLTVNTEREEGTCLIAYFEDLSEGNEAFHKSNAIDRTRGDIAHEATEASVSFFDRQSHTYYIVSGNFEYDIKHLHDFNP